MEKVETICKLLHKAYPGRSICVQHGVWHHARTSSEYEPEYLISIHARGGGPITFQKTGPDLMELLWLADEAVSKIEAVEGPKHRRALAAKIVDKILTGIESEFEDEMDLLPWNAPPKDENMYEHNVTNEIEQILAKEL